MDGVLALALGAFLLTIGATHFLVPDYYASLIPPRIPGSRRAWVFGSGVVEMALGVALLFGPTRLLAAWAVAALFAGYTLTHVEALLRASTRNVRWLDRPSGAVTRVAINLSYVVWALLVALST